MGVAVALRVGGCDQPPERQHRCEYYRADDELADALAPFILRCSRRASWCCRLRLVLLVCRGHVTHLRSPIPQPGGITSPGVSARGDGPLFGHTQLPQHEPECQASSGVHVSSIKRDKTPSAQRPAEPSGAVTSFYTASRAHLRRAGPDGPGREQRRASASSREGMSGQGDPP